ncbi:hypothetical protein JKF63_01824 [Porcisia hertigi]|uniref:Flagellar attachment zone protein 1 conserved domain-containing protein n=1 Tax=Porcisia hertigi TaxID=2761500 RepID=A0A836IBA9_9TRYP|nr:hypothetical protein JKF63_01824 [Porcisia hertigi]
MACVPSKGSIVSYEFLDSQTKWVWGVGTVTRSDDRVCVVEQWVGTLLDSTMTAEVEKEVAFSNAEAKAHQGRLLAIRERINLQGANTSKEEKENTSKELMQCLAVIGKHRSHSRSLLADLEKIKGPSGVPAKAQQFIPGSYSVTVLCSSVLEVISQTKKLSVFLSSEEIDSIENVVTHSRRHLNSELHQLRATVEAAEIESEALRQRVGELEEKLIFLENTSRPLQVCDGVGRRSARSEELQERQPLDFRRAWDDDASLVVTNHIFTFPWDNGDILLHHKPEETKFVLVAEAAFACCVPTQCVLNPKMTTSENHLSAEFSISHPNTMTATEVDQRLAAYTFPSLHRLHKEPLGAKIGLDRAIEDLENALGIPEGKHEGLFFDEFVETIQKDSLSGDKDAYESEIGDLLMLLDKLNNENRSLQYALDKSAAELKKQMEASQKDKDTLTTEIDRLRDITAKLKILAEQQEKELEIHRVHNRNAEQERLVHNLAPLEGGPGSPVYAVTLGEYTRQAKATEDAEEALEIAQTKSDELHQRLEEVEQQCAHQAEKLRELEIALETEKQTAAENSSALERELIDLVAQLKAQKGYAEALGHINEEQKKELCSFHTKRHTALAEREAHPAFRFPISSSSPTVASNMPSMPATTDEEPLYSVTLEEYRSRDAAVEQLTAELEEQRALAEMLAAEVAAFRMKRNAALEARDADGTLPVLGEPVSADEAAAHALEPQQIADEPLYAVTLGEYTRQAKATEDAEEALEIAQTKSDELHQRLEKVEQQCAHQAEKLRELEIALETEKQTAAENSSALERELIDLVAQLKAQKGYAEVLGHINEEQKKELCSFHTKRNTALAEREAHPAFRLPISSSSPTVASNMPSMPATTDEEPLYSVTLEEYRSRDAAVEQLTAELEEQRALAEMLAAEVAAFRMKRNAALEARDADGTLSVLGEPMSADEAAAHALEPQQIADEPLYAVTLGEYCDRGVAVEQLTAELEEQRALAEMLAAEVAAFRMKRNAALEARDADGTLSVLGEPVSADEAAAHALEPQQIADEPLYAVTLGEYCDRGVAVEQLTAELEEQRALAEMLAAEVAAFRMKRNAALEARDADGTLSVLGEPVSADEAAAHALEPQQIADEPLYAVTLGEYCDRGVAVEQLTAELEEQRALAEMLAAEVAAFRMKRNAALEARDADGTLSVLGEPVSADEAAAHALEPQQIADEPLYAVTLGEYCDRGVAVEQLTAELEEQRALAEMLAAEVAAFRMKRNAALEARDADGTLSVLGEPVSADEAAAHALEPQQIADEPLYAVTLGEYCDRGVAVEQLTAELEEQRALAEMLAAEVAAFRMKRNAALEARDADGTLSVLGEPVSADEAAAHALEPQQIADEPLYAVTLGEYCDRGVAVEQLTAELEEQRALAEMLAAEVAAFRMKRNAALEARDADGTLSVLGEPVSADEAAAHALEPQQIADEPLYAVTLGEYCDRGVAVEQLTAELEEQRALAEMLAAEVAAFRMKRNAALEARDADGTLSVLGEPVSADEAAAHALEPQQIADEPLYAVTLGEYCDRGVAVEQLTAELEEQRALAEMLAAEVAAFRMKRNAALEARDADGTLSVLGEPVSADEAAAHALEPQQIADEPLYAVTLGEYCDRGVVVEQLTAELEEQRALAEMLAAEVAAFRMKRNAALEARDADGTLSVLGEPVSADEAAAHALEPQQIADEPLYAVTLGEYCDRGVAVEQLTAELEEQRALAEMLAAEVAAFRMKRNAALEARDADGTLSVLGEPVSADEAAAHALEPQQIADEPLYAVTLGEYCDRGVAVEQLTAELEEQRALAEMLAAEVAAFRMKRNAALEARDADGTLSVLGEPVSADEAAAHALEPQQIADEPLYAVTLGEYCDRGVAVEQLTAELEEQRALAEMLAAEVAAFRMKRNAALEARDADGTLPVLGEPVSADEAAAHALEPQQIADEPLYAVTLGEYCDRGVAVEQLTAELEEQRALAEMLAAEVAAFRMKRNAALEARDADGTLSVLGEPVSADEAAAHALEPQQIADEPLYAVTLGEYCDRGVAVEQLTAELEEQRALAEMLAAEVAAFRMKRNAALEARDADGTLSVLGEPVSADEAAAHALEPQQIADEPLYAVTLGEYCDRGVAVEQLTAELEEQRALAEMLAAEVAAFRMKRNAALEARDADGTLSVLGEPVSADEAAAHALEPQQIADEPLYAVTLGEYCDRGVAVEQLTAELEEQRALAEMLAAEVAAFRMKRNAALEARDADGTLSVLGEPVSADEAAAHALEPQQIADEPLYAVTLGEYCDRGVAVEQLTAELEEQRALAEMLAAEVAAFRMKRNAALEARDADGTLSVLGEPVSADEAAAHALEPQQIADEPLYAVTLGEYCDRGVAVEQLTAELEEQRALAEMLAAEVAAFRMKRNAALEARDADGTLSVLGEPVSADEAAAHALEPQQIADEPLYAVTLGEYCDRGVVVEQLTAELEEQRALAEMLAAEVAAFRMKRNAALEARDADGTLSVLGEPVSADEAAAHALEPQQIADEPLYAVTLGEYCDRGVAVEQLTAELEEQRALAEMLAAEVAAFRMKRNAALEARDADGTLSVLGEPVSADEAAAHALEPQQIADEPLYAVTLGEYCDRGVAVEQLTAELEEQRALAEMLAAEVAAFRMKRNAALEARDADGTLSVLGEPVSADEAAAHALEPQQIADEPLYAVTLGEYCDRGVAVEQLTAELEEQRALAEMLAAEVAAFRMKRNAALEARDADGTLSVLGEPVSADEAAAHALEPQQIADEPLYAVTLGEYCDRGVVVEQLTAELEEQRALAEMLAAEVAAFRMKRNAALEARDADGTLSVLGEPMSADEAAAHALEPQQIADEPLYAVTLGEYCDRGVVVEQLTAELEEQRALAEMLAAEVAAFRMKRNAALEARDADGTLSVLGEPVSADEAAAHALEPQQIADEPLYAVTLGEYCDRGVAVEQLTAELEEQRALAEMLAAEVAAFRMKRNAALEARDADGTLPVLGEPVSADEAAAHALEPQQIADEPLYAVTLGEYCDRGVAVEQLTAELEEQRALAEMLAAEVAAFRMKRNAALEARDADGTLSVLGKPMSADEAAAHALEPQQIADEPLYAVTLGEYCDRGVVVEQLTAELEEQRALAEMLAAEVAAFRMKRNAALEARDADGTLSVLGEPMSADEAAAHALEPQQIADEPLYAVTLGEYCDRGVVVEQLTAELEEQRALAEMLAAEVAAFRMKRNAALEARDADGTLSVLGEPVSADEAAAHALEPQQIADEPLYAVTLGEYCDRGVAVEQLTAELEEQRALAEMLAAEVAAFRMKRNAALEARDADGTLPVLGEPVSADEAAAHALEPQQIADEPLYAVTLGEYCDRGVAVEQLTAELEEQRALAEMLAAEVAAFRMKRNAALEARDADGTLPVLGEPVSADEAAAHALEPQQIADEPLYAVTLGEYTRQAKATEDAEEALEIAQTKSDELHQRLEEVEQQCAHQAEKLRELEIALETEKQTAAENSSALERELIDLVAQLKAQKGYAEALGHINEEQKKELCSFHTKRNTALAEREAHPAFRFPISSSSPTVASNMPSMPATTDEEPLYSVTLEEYRSRDAAVEQLTAELEEQRALAEMLAAEVAAFRMKRNAALEARDADGTLSVLGEPVSADEAAAHALEPQQIADEPLYAVTLGEYCDRGVAVEQLTAELEELRDKNSQMVRELEALSKRICDVVSAERETNPVREDLITQLEGLLRALEGAREAERAAFAVAEEKERELSQLRIVFTNEEERLNNDLEEAREEVKRLQGELDLLTDKLEEVYRLFGDADAANAEGVAKLEDLAEVLTAARVAERDIMDLLEAKESELAQFRSVLELRKDSENMLECLRDEVAQLHREKEITEMELGAAQKELNDLRYDLHAAEDKATEKAREVEGMTLDLEALNDRIRDLLEELQEKTDQYNQVIKDLDDFAKHQSHEDEKDLLQRLAVREQELFKLQEVRRGEISEHEKQVGMLQDQVDRLRDQTDQDNTLHKGLQDDLARLRKLLADANAALQDKTTENEALKDDIEGMIDEHESQMREMEQVLETKSQEVSDALGRLEEMTAMLQEAREGEESALRLRADSDAEVFRMQKELDRVKQLQSALSDSADDRGGLLAQLMDTEGQLRDAEAVIRRKDTELAESKELLKKLNKSEDLNYDLRRMLKLTMAALSKSKDTMSNSAGSLDVVRTELRPMLH